MTRIKGGDIWLLSYLQKYAPPLEGRKLKGHGVSEGEEHLARRPKLLRQRRR